MIALYFLLATALAATPGGFRMGTAQAVDAAGARTVLIVNPGDEIIGQVTPRVSKVWGKYGFDVEIAALIQNGRGGYLFGGLGSLRTGHWYVHEGSAGKSTHRFGVELAVPLLPPYVMENTRAQAWGSSMQDTVTVGLIEAGWLGSWGDRSPIDLRVMSGWGTAPHILGHLLVELGVAKAFALSDVTSIVLEQDMVVQDESPANFRPMIRFDIDRSVLDLGFQLPWGSWLDNPPASVQFITQYRGRF